MVSFVQVAFFGGSDTLGEQHPHPGTAEFVRPLTVEAIKGQLLQLFYRTAWGFQGDTMTAAFTFTGTAIAGKIKLAFATMGAEVEVTHFAIG
ncbi:MAG: hypothetical protein BroJett015_33670 [Chloroflexota bacterium]|nr:MAG: hypothetical protein BroJett015_33670 [Chloroflexota bacterium]